MTDPTPQPSLDRLIVRLSSLIAAATDALEQNRALADDWYDEIARQITRYSTAAYLSGAGVATPSASARRMLDTQVRAQLDFLDKFKVEIQDADEWQAGWNARAQMYAQSIKAPYWSGKTQLLPLPAMPGDGTTQCLTRCGCAWDVQQLDGDGNYDAYWRRGKTDSCQTCLEREAEWSPLQIRDGDLI